VLERVEGGGVKETYLVVHDLMLGCEGARVALGVSRCSKVG